MSFRENLKEKIKIKSLANTVRKTIGTSESGLRVDLDAMGRLLEMGGYSSFKERDLILYILEGDAEAGRLLVLDNELAVYQTSAEDVGLRKSPTVKEMVTFRNIKKILNDADVVVSRRDETLNSIYDTCIGKLDLHYESSDIQELADSGKAALASGDSEQVLESLMLFSELLSFKSPPPLYRFKEFEIKGIIQKMEDGSAKFGPLVVYSPAQNILKYIDYTIDSRDREEMERFNKILMNEADPSTEGPDVFDRLEGLVIGS